MTTIPSAVRAQCARLGDAAAIVTDDTTVSYRLLDERVVEAARALMSVGVERGDRVAIWAPNSLGWIVAGLAIHHVGAAIVPINTRWKGAEAAYVLRASGARVLFTQVGFLDTDTVEMLGADSTPLDALERVVLLPGSDRVETFERAIPVVQWDDFTAGGTAVPSSAVDARSTSVAPTDTSDVLFTSGTTGRPKGVIMSHAQTVRQFTEWCDFAGLREGDRYLIVNPFFHMFGYKAGWLASLLRGATIYPVPVFDVATVLALIEREAITVFPGAPTIYRTILDHPGRHERDLSSLRVAVTGAADIPVSLIEEMRAELPFETILTGYGLTEAGTVTGSRPGDDSETIATTAGRAMDGLEVIIADRDGNEVDRSETGELLVRGYSVMQEYLDDPEATAAALDERGFLHTGDLATMDERGYVKIVGRSKDMIIVGGFNVYPAEVESALLEHTDVGQAAVIGVPDERMGEIPIAFVVAAAGRRPDPDEIVAWGRDRMANYKAPRSVRVISELPLNASGKVVKDDLRALAGKS